MCLSTGLNAERPDAFTPYSIKKKDCIYVTVFCQLIRFCCCLNYNVQNVRIDIECKFEYKSNALMPCTVKLSLDNRTANWTQDKTVWL